MLEELAKKDKYWRKIAYDICNDKALADDLVQDMYIYFSTKKIKVNDAYVYKKIYHLFLDYLRKDKGDIRVDELFYLKDTTIHFEPDDEQLEVLLRYQSLFIL